ncbi:pleckstrin homology domain-containing family A member 4-like isoform X2 [Columba livia]|uniref:pleckstrin homology domain-containing family A member 4-like isoform X2 n=1 Tax=Columba livia TaxID=8932 RepID=UPI0031BAAF4C
MADGDQPPRRAPTPAGTHGPGTQVNWARGAGTGPPAGAGSPGGSEGPPLGAPALGQAPAQPCRAVRRVHAFGKGGQALRRDPRTPPTMRGWLHKQDSSGLRLWKRRWFVLVDLCLYYYRDSSEQQVRGGLPLPGYEIRVLPPALRTPRFLFTAEHPGMRTYCLGAETAEELNAWVCALRQGASPLSGSPGSLSLQTPPEPRSAGPLFPLLPAHPPGWCSLCPAGEELGGPLMSPPRRPLVPPLPLSKEEAPAQRESCRTKDTRGESPVCDGAAAAGRSPRELRPPGAQTNEPPSSDAAEQDIVANQTLTSATGFSDWLLAYEAIDGAPPSPGTASLPPANETSLWRRASGRSLEREGVAGRGARRPIRITLLQASF